MQLSGGMAPALTLTEMSSRSTHMAMARRTATSVRRSSDMLKIMRSGVGFTCEVTTMPPAASTSAARVEHAGIDVDLAVEQGLDGRGLVGGGRRTRWS